MPRRSITISFLMLFIPFLLSAKDAARYHVQKGQLEDGTESVILSDKLMGIEATIIPSRGGELSGLRVRFRGQWHELIYRALDYRTTDGWRGKAPLLWPAVGRNFAAGTEKKANNFSYDHEGKRYEIPIHGFARFKSWRIVNMHNDRKGAEVDLVLTDDEASRKQYPFGFEFHVIHRLSNGKYEAYYKVTAAGTNRSPMFFSTGNHITFNIPFVDGSSLNDFHLETPLTLQYLLDEHSIPTGKTQLQHFTPAVAITGFKKNEAVSVGGFKGREPWVKLSDPAGIAVRVIHHISKPPKTSFVQFNLWGSVQDGYFSPEPWVGFQNSLNSHQGLIYLPAGKTWTWKVKVEIERKL